MINPGDPIFIGAFWGLVLAILLSIGSIFWLTSVTVPNPAITVIGAVIGAVIGCLIILAWVDTLIFPTPLPNVNGGAVFFGSVLFCSATGVIGGIITNALITRRRKGQRDEVAAEH